MAISVYKKSKRPFFGGFLDVRPRSNSSRDLLTDDTGLGTNSLVCLTLGSGLASGFGSNVTPSFFCASNCFFLSF